MKSSTSQLNSPAARKGAGFIRLIIVARQGAGSALCMPRLKRVELCVCRGAFAVAYRERVSDEMLVPALCPAVWPSARISAGWG
jgi:hypothetical protein